MILAVLNYSNILVVILSFIIFILLLIIIYLKLYTSSYNKDLHNIIQKLNTLNLESTNNKILFSKY